MREAIEGVRKGCRREEAPNVENARAVVRLREAIHVSQVELAQQASLSRMTLARIESGERSISAQEWRALLKALDGLNRRRQREFAQVLREVGSSI